MIYTNTHHVVCSFLYDSAGRAQGSTFQSGVVLLFAQVFLECITPCNRKIQFYKRLPKK
jgi:hypothetical protein